MGIVVAAAIAAAIAFLFALVFRRWFAESAELKGDIERLRRKGRS